ncbi:unnamed protein product [Callosobruchus maculatus]|uniref:Reverse transcriptase domain-containing protein n=1 Tax=Callosobruchus maculatus TaxID=64391 RepID=A0A653CSX3_CALMS|nr:unnamed protein product [Callosobruchus maculatus]
MEGHSANDSTKDLLAELVKALRSTRTAPEQVDLPIFRPDISDAKKWLIEIENIKDEFEWSDQQLIVRLGRFLTGISKTWFENWSPDIKTWDIFVRDFLEAFPPKKILGELLLKAAEFSSNRCNTYEAYVFEKVTLLRNLRAHWDEADLVEIIVHGIVERDVRITASNQNHKKISELISYLGSVPKRRLDEPRTDRNSEVREPPRKRFRESLDDDRKRKRPLTCYGCGKNGHTLKFCFERKKDEETPKNSLSAASSSKSSRANSDLSCSFCFKTGHKVEDCFLKKGIEKRRNVNRCSSGKSGAPCEMIINGILMKGIIDTGADVSLIPQKHAEMFRNKMVARCTIIGGLLPGHYVSEQSITCNFEMSGVKTELTFIVVPDSFLEYDVLVGCNLYNDPDIVTITNHAGTQIVKNKVARVLDIFPNSVNFDLDVPDIHRPKLLKVLSHYSDIIATSGNAVSCVNNTTLHIRLRDNYIVNRSPYRLSLTERKIVQDIINDLLSNNIIQESESPFASPIILVKKKDCSYRMCVDFRDLNQHTIKDRYPLPLIDDQLDRLGKGKVFTSLDMSSGFHQIPIDADSVHKTAFVTPDGHFEYLRMPFGLANAPAVFQRAINRALGNLRNTEALVYLDDILIPSETVEDNLTSLGNVLQALKNAGFSLNLKKCHFLQDKLEYLGREVSAEGIRPGIQKVEALTKSPYLLQ